MAFEKDELKQFEQIIGKVIVEKVPELIRYEVQPMLDRQKKETILDTKILIQQGLRSIKEDIKWIKNKLEKIKIMESEDVKVAYLDIEFLKKKVKELESKIKHLQLTRV